VSRNGHELIVLAPQFALLDSALAFSGSRIYLGLSRKKWQMC
jgi:hypothetical protein